MFTYVGLINVETLFLASIFWVGFTWYGASGMSSSEYVEAKSSKYSVRDLQMVLNSL